MSSPSPEARELALLLVRKAEGDESILDKLLDDSDVPDDMLGFHAQQAIEKRLKAVLAFHEVDYDRTHSIGYLTSSFGASRDRSSRGSRADRGADAVGSRRAV